MRSLSRDRLASASAVVALAALPFALFWRVTLGASVFAEGDLLSYNYPLLSAITQQWKTGDIPLWNPYIFGGTPLHANMQGGAFYPPNLIFLLLPTWIAYQYSILLHYSLAGVFMFLFVRALPTRRSAAMVGAVAFMLGGFAMGHLGHVSTVRTIPWLPLLLYAFEKWRRSLDPRLLALASVSIGLMLLAGHPQIPLYALGFGAAYALWFVVAASGRDRSRVAIGFLLSLLLGAGLAAVQLIPTAQLALQEYLRPADRSYGYFINYSLHPAILANLVFARLVPVDESELAVYVGVPTLVLALCGAWRTRPEQRSHRLFFLCAIPAALVLSFGGWTGLSRLLFQVPLYNLFTSPARNLFEFNFAVAVLAALGADSLSEATLAGARKRAVAAFVTVLLLGAGLVAAKRLTGSAFPAEAAALAEVRWADPNIVNALPVLLATLAIVLCGSRARRWAGMSLLLVLAMDLSSYARGVYRLSAPSDYTTPPPALAFLRQQHQHGRILTLGALESTPSEMKALLSPDLNAAYDIESINGFDSLMLRQVDEASGHVMPTFGLVLGADNYNSPQFQRFMDLLNTRFVLTHARESLDLRPPRYKPVYEDSEVRIFENTQALPRAFLVPTVRPATHEGALIALATGFFGGKPFDPRRLALVEGLERASATSSTPDPQWPSDGVRALSYGGGWVKAVVEANRPLLFVHSASHSRGWQAFVDAQPARVYRVDGLLQGVLVPPGRHLLSLRYSPASFWLGGTLSLLGVVLVVLVGARRRRPRPTSRDAPPTPG